jgi:hypothetical protein
MAKIEDCSDLSTFAPDGTPGLQIGKRVTGVLCVLQWVARRWLSRVNGVVWDATTRINVGDLRNADPTQEQLDALGPLLENEAALVPFVRRATVRIARVSDGGDLRIGGAIELVTAGTYPLVVSISGAKVALQFPTVKP